MPASFRNKSSASNSGRHGSRRNALTRVHSHGVVPANGHATPGTLRRVPTIDRKNSNSQERERLDHLEKEQPQHQYQLPSSICTRQNIPTHATFSLTKISSLLQYISPGTLVAFDIDDTLIRKTNYGCSLLTSLGTRQFGEYLKNQYRNASYAEKQDITNALYKELSSFVLAEDETVYVVNELQKRGAYVFGLTARSSNLASFTTSSLAALGIDLLKTAPPTLPLRIIDSETNASVVDGVVYCNDTDKGIVFQRLLNLGWLSWPQQDQSSRVRDGHEPSDDGKCCPQRSVWFVDDNLPMVMGMIKHWSHMAENQVRSYKPDTLCNGKLSLVCCHYTHPLASTTPPIPYERLHECINLQIEEFIRSRRLISDIEALKIIDGMKAD